jgi:UDP:flavonoid glycosyltransferase YjiC (YdhE family)
LSFARTGITHSGENTFAAQILRRSVARYLLAASPLAGHVMPMLTIAADLRQRGHDVTFMTAASFHAAAVRRGLRAVDLPARAQPHPSDVGWSALSLPSLLDLWRRGRADMRSVLITPLVAQHHALDAQLKSQSFDALLVDVAFTGVLPLLLGDRDHPPVAVCGVSPLMLSSVDTPPFGVGWHPRSGFDYARMNWFVRHVLFADVQARLNAALRTVRAGPSPVFLNDWPKLADRVLQLTVPAAEYLRSDLPPSVTFTGPILARSITGAAAPARWQSRMRHSRKVVHVTQGTWDNLDHGQLIGPTLDALADRSDVLVIATTGLPDQPAFTGTVPDNAHVTDYIPYASLLPHVDVMITNGGYGGVQHALAHGIPLIVAGRSADKPEVAARVSYIGAGIDLRTDRPEPKAIAAAVGRILTTADYRDAARAVGNDIAATAPLDVIADVLAGMHASDPLPQLIYRR